MKLSNEEKDRVLAAISKLQRIGPRVRLTRLQAASGYAPSRFTSIVKALVREGKIRLGGHRGFRWCVTEVADKRQQLIQSVNAECHPYLEFTDLRQMTGLPPEEIVALCIELHLAGSLRIATCAVAGLNTPDLDEDEEEEEEEAGIE